MSSAGEVGDSNEARLVASAAEVFSEKGYDRAGVAEIAARAGLTTGAIYSRFSGKAELLSEAINLYTRHEFDRLFAEGVFDGGGTDLIVRLGANLATREPDASGSLLLEAFVAARRDPDMARLVREHLEDQAETLRVVFEDSKASGLVDESLDTDALVHFAHAVGLGFLLFEAIGVPNPTPGPWRDLVTRVVMSVAPRQSEMSED